MPKSSLSTYEPVSNCPDVYSALSGNSRGFAVKLIDGSVCLFNPVSGISDTVVTQLEKIGRVKFILTPNHYHNKVLREISARFPKAKMCASLPATPRLTDLTNLSFSKTTQVEKKFPDGVRLLQPQGLKTGEVWLSVKTTVEHLWVVGDAFGGSKLSGKKTVAQPTLLKTFPSYGVADAKVYQSWALNQISQDQPTIVLPCHGDVFASKQLPARLSKLLNINF